MEALADRIERRAREAASLHHRLVLVAGPPGSGKTTALRKLRDRTGPRRRPTSKSRPPDHFMNKAEVYSTDRYMPPTVLSFGVRPPSRSLAKMSFHFAPPPPFAISIRHLGRKLDAGGVPCG